MTPPNATCPSPPILLSAKSNDSKLGKYESSSASACAPGSVILHPDASSDMIGATINGSSEIGLGELADKAAIKTYLDSYTSDWKDRDAEDNEIDFDQDAAATMLWAKKIS